MRKRCACGKQLSSSYMYATECQGCDPNLLMLTPYMDGAQGPHEIDTDNDDELICPHCGHEQGDSWEHGDEGEADCGNCEKSFHFTCEYTRNYTSSRTKLR